MITPKTERNSRRPKPSINPIVKTFRRRFWRASVVCLRWKKEYGYFPSKRRIRRKLAKL